MPPFPDLAGKCRTHRGTQPQPKRQQPKYHQSRYQRLCDTEVESANPVLRGVRFGRHDTFDRLAFDFCQPADTTLTATVVKQLIEDGSGDKSTSRASSSLP